MNMEPFWKSVDVVLDKFPNLKQQIPPSWPRCITSEQLSTYEQHRTDKFWEHQNLACLAYTLGNSSEERTCSLYESILAALEWFSTEMPRLPKATSTLKPLWENPWNIDDNPFWSVVSEVKMAQLLQANKWAILGFHQTIGTSSENADIFAKRNGIESYIDVEAASMTKIVEGAEEDFRRFIATRAKTKIDKKFKYVPQKECGIIAMVFRPRCADVRRFSYRSWTTNRVETCYPNVWANVYWLVAGQRSGEKFSLHLVDNTLLTSLS